ncbi:MAG TPA: hypothetical protein VM938_12535 [Acidimicrobiales bacterium]|nr:hypothetical protein [Acidimicrobiales bacterium]
MTAPLALPAGGGARHRSTLSLAALLVGAGGFMLFGTLIAVYVLLRSRVHPFPPEDATLDQYLGNMLVITMLLSSATVEWGISAVRRGIGKQAAAAFGITVGFGLAFLNLLAFTANHADYGASTHAYGTVVTAMVLALAVAVAIGIAFVVLTLFRLAGSQVSAADPDQARALGWYWQFTVVATVAVWYTVVVLK